MNGFLVLDKPAGMTSFAAVRKVQKLFGRVKAGHGGTLDPEVTGVLPVFIGNATRAIDLLPDSDKTYRAVIRLGVKTDTEDLTGRILEEKEVLVSDEEAREAVLSFIGDYYQTPPMVSAKKVNGKKLVNLSRRGIEVERKAELRHIRQIVIEEIALPEIRFTATVSKGTYIRTLAADIGEKLGCGAAMKSLRRLQHGRFTEEEAVTPETLEKAAKEGRTGDYLRPVDSLFPDLPAVTIVPEAERFLQNGNTLEHWNFREDSVKNGLPVETSPDGRYRIYAPGGEFRAIYAFSPETGKFTPVRMFPS